MTAAIGPAIQCSARRVHCTCTPHLKQGFARGQPECDLTVATLEGSGSSLDITGNAVLHDCWNVMMVASGKSAESALVAQQLAV